MHLLSILLLFWAGVSAASLAAAVLVVAVEVMETDVHKRAATVDASQGNPRRAS